MTALLRLSPLLAVLGACKADTTPAWALDPIWIEPGVAPAADLHGFQTWQVYGEQWRVRPDERYYSCAVVVELTGTETEPCPDCTIAWTVDATLLESDCPLAVQADPVFLSLRGLGIGELTGGAAEHPGLTSAGYADYGAGWEPHGQAWPAALDAGEPVDDGGWDGVAPFTLWPDAIWPLAGGDALTPVSRETGAPMSRAAR